MLLVFDLDGTLVDSSQDLAEAASELVQGYGGAPLAVTDVMTMVGDGAPLLVRRALERSGLDPDTSGAFPRFLEIYDRRLMDHTVAYDGMHEVLALLVGRGPMAVLTNKPLAPSIAILEALGLRGFFSDVVGGDGPHARKPLPDGLLAIEAAWRSDPSSSPVSPGPTVMIGDSPTDARTAAAAGCAFVFARYGFGAGKFGATPPATNWAVDHPRELPGVLERITLNS